MNNKCTVCETDFKDWFQYNTHKETNTCFKKIQPVRTTARSVAQIIHDTEKMWGYAIFPTIQPWHAMAVR